MLPLQRICFFIWWFKRVRLIKVRFFRTESTNNNGAVIRCCLIQEEEGISSTQRTHIKLSQWSQ